MLNSNFCASETELASPLNPTSFDPGNALDSIITDPMRATLLGIALLASSLYCFSSFKQQYPNAPTLRISRKPWIWGEREDAKLYVTNALDLLQLGWEKYSKHGTNYLLSIPKRKIYIVAPKYMEEIRRAPESHVDNTVANSELTQVAWTLHPRLAWDQFHFHVPISKNLTESLGPKLPDIVEEAKMSLEQYIGVSTKWTERKMYPLGFDIITRTANRLLFGLSLTRNQEFQSLSVRITGVMFSAAEMVRSWPRCLKPLVMRLGTDIHAARALGMKHLLPLVLQRFEDEDRHIAEGREDEWRKERPSDVISWCMDAASPSQRRDADTMVLRLLHINTAAIHTSSITFLEAFYFLAISTQYLPELREEIISVFRKEGRWTKQALTYLIKLDSFLVEAMRFCPFTALKMQRYTIKDWTLKDGTVIPRGVYFWCNFTALSLDEDTFEKPYEFDPWRMYRRRQQEGQANQHQFVMTSEVNLTFGHGKKACPGRFFAANEIKILMALIIMNYDFTCDNLKGGVEAIRTGGWTNITKNPIDYPIVKFKFRRDQIPEDVRHNFIDI